MNYKKSKYNIFVPYKNNETIVFNGVSGSIGKFDDYTLKRFETNNLKDFEIEELLKRGILVDETLDEIKKINEDRAKGINNKNKKLFRIWTTSGCNARCYYCFEKGMINKTMDLPTAEAVVNFIANMLENKDELVLEWFGGEPLLNITAIEFIIAKLKPICKEKDCILKSNIITNGSLINEEIAKKMCNEWNVKSVQITLDGFGGFYNSVKNYKNPQKHNFNNVIEAIKILAQESVHIAVRMNYDTKNYESLVELIKFLHTELENFKNISYYVYPVWSSVESDKADAFNSVAEADLNMLKLFDLLVKNKMSTIRRIARLNYKENACQAWSKTSFAILPDGKLSKCSESYHQNIGDVWNGVVDNILYNFWTDANIEDKCKECVYLPLCQGGCKSSYFNRMPHCFAFKPIMNDILKWYIEHLDNELNKK